MAINEQMAITDIDSAQTETWTAVVSAPSSRFIKWFSIYKTVKKE